MQPMLNGYGARPEVADAGSCGNGIRMMRATVASCFQARNTAEQPPTLAGVYYIYHVAQDSTAEHKCCSSV
jgi:hypothetical protein